MAFLTLSKSLWVIHALTNDTEKLIHDKQEKLSEGIKKIQTLLK